MMPSCLPICLSLLPACATQQTVCFHPSYRPRLRPVIPYCAGQVFSSDTVTRASRPYPRGPRSGQGCSVPVHQHLLTSSKPLACTPRFPSCAGYTESLCWAGAPADVILAFVGLTARLEGEEMRVNAKGFSGGDRTDIVLP